METSDHEMEETNGFTESDNEWLDENEDPEYSIKVYVTRSVKMPDLTGISEDQLFRGMRQLLPDYDEGAQMSAWNMIKSADRFRGRRYSD